MKKRITAILGSIIVPVLLLTTTMLIFLFSKGYRFDFKDGEIEKTGVISVKTTPRKASVYIDGQLAGTSPRAFDGLKEGSHTLLVKKENYYDWEMTVNIEAEQLIPLEITLFLKNPRKTTLFPSSKNADADSKVLLFSANERSTAAVFCVLNKISIPVTQSEADTDTAIPSKIDTQTNPKSDINSDMIANANSQSKLQIWSYSLVRRFWETEASPVLLAEFTSEEFGVDLTELASYDVSLMPSPDGELTLFYLLPLDKSLQPKYYLLSVGRTNASPIRLTQLYGAESLSWNQNSQHLMYMRGQELRSLNVTSLIQTVIFDQNSLSLLWTTNNSGTVFIVSKTEEKTSLLSARPDGSAPTVLFELIPPNDENLDETAQNQSLEENVPDAKTSDDRAVALVLKNAVDMRITPDNTKLILFTSDAILLYSLNNSSLERYDAIDPSFISFSPNNSSFLYKNSDGTYCEFWFVTEEHDPLHVKGPRVFFRESLNEKVNFTIWHSIAGVLMYSQNSMTSGSNSLFVLHTENLQTNLIADLPDKASFAVEGSGKRILAECEGSALCLYSVRE